jgi:hypothetical protein
MACTQRRVVTPTAQTSKIAIKVPIMRLTDMCTGGIKFRIPLQKQNDIVSHIWCEHELSAETTKKLHVQKSF